MSIFGPYKLKMLKIHQDYSLSGRNSFGVREKTNFFAEPKNHEELVFLFNYIKRHSLNWMILGEGSNMLFTHPFEGIIIHPIMPGIEKADESASEVLVKAGAGENWDHFVDHCVENNWFGAENLSLIPGSVGAAPVQNIGAYGVEAKDLVEYVEVFDTQNLKAEVLSNAACEFGYRDSIFKHGNSSRYVVTSVLFRLQKEPNFTLEYGNVKQEFLKHAEQNQRNLRNTIISIRREKLPDPQQTGNAGSFFKNPVISLKKYYDLQQEYPSLPMYAAGENMAKVPAAWLIENAGWKGIREGEVGTWPSQPLVLVNYGGASGNEIFLFSEKIRNAVEEKFGILLEREVTVVD